MRKILLLSLFLLHGLVYQAAAQERTVTGRVTSATDGSGLPGVNVTVKGASGGTITDVQGQYSIAVPQSNATLVFSYVGFQTQEIAVGNQSTINVQLAEDVKQIDEVVITGALGIQREQKSIGYAAQTIDGSAVSAVRETNVVNQLSGRVAGVQVGVNTGAMGGSSRVVIRGNSSITGNNNALFVVDGVPIENSNSNSSNQQRGAGGYDYGNPIQDINPADIAEITVLKGAAATALYGSRGANGVIQITTKKGGKKNGIGVTYTLGVTLDKVYKLPKYQNEYGGGFGFDTLYYDKNPEAFPAGQKGYYTDANGRSYDLIPHFATDESWGPKMEGQVYRPYYSFDGDKGNPQFGEYATWSPKPNNIRNFFETGTTLTNAIAIDGASDAGSFRLSYSNLDQKFVLPNSNLNRHNVGFNGIHKASKNLTVSVGANYITHKAVGRPGTGYDGENVMMQFTQWGQRQLDMEQSKNYKLPDGTQLSWNRTSWNNPKPKYTDNPYWTRYENYQNDSRDRLFGNFAVNYRITDYLSAEVKAMTDVYSETQEERIAIGSQAIPQYRLNRIRFMENNLQGMLNFYKDLGPNISLSAFAGANLMKRSRDFTDGVTVGGLSSRVYNLSASIGRPNVVDFKSQKQINSVFASASFGFYRQLYLDLSGRNDWSSTLPLHNNSYFYPSASLSWVFSEIMKADWITLGKVRAAVGGVGNDTDPYNTLMTYSLHQPFGSNSRVSVPNTLLNENLKPERTFEYELGTEWRVFNDRLGLNASVYNRQTYDQILPLSVSAASGYSFRFVNAGLVENKGVEISLTGTPVKTRDFSWNIIANWARNRNKVVELTPEQKTIILATAPFAVTLQAREGEALGSIVGYDYTYDDQGRKIVGANGRYVRSTEQKVLGTVNPDFTGGITNTFTYKNFSLSGLIDFQKGGSFFSTTQMFGRYSGILQETVANGIRENGIVVEGVKADGSPNDKNIDAFTHFLYNGGYILNAADIVDASYVYLRELNLGYSLPKSITGRTPFTNVRLALVGRNLWLIHSNSEHVDPSNITNSITNVQGLEGGALPSTRSYGFTLTLGL